MENTGFRVRVDDTLRASFIAACKGRERTAAQVLREFMRHYIQQNGNSLPEQIDQRLLQEKIVEELRA